MVSKSQCMSGGESKTEEQVTTTLVASERHLPQLGPHQLFMVFHYRGDSKTIELSEGDSYVVGREFPAEIILADPRLSRQHARIICKDGEIRAQDLGSLNGIIIHGRKVNETLVPVGEAISLGDVTACLFLASKAKTGTYAIKSYDTLSSRLSEEILRARQFKRCLTLAMLRSATRFADSDESSSQVHRFWMHVCTSLRAVDTIGLYGANSVLVILPEVDAEKAFSWATELVNFCPESNDLTCGLASYPNSGTTTEELITAAHEACHAANLKNRIVRFQSESPSVPLEGEYWVVHSDKMIQLHHLIKRVASSPVPVLVVGETGTGKELVALAVHHHSDRSSKPFKAVNCAAIPDTLMESTIFGHERGAFTGALKTTPGVFESAADGTVFLDEVGELSSSTQAALLRVVETKRLTRIGGSKEIEVRSRIVAATNCDLQSMVEQGTFREDLFYRLNTVVLEVPPLRERIDEIEPLVAHFLRQIDQKLDRPGITIHADALEALKSYHWPGNIRQLRNIIERAVVICWGDEIQLLDLPESIANLNSQRMGAPSIPCRQEISENELIKYSQTIPSTDKPIIQAESLSEQVSLQNEANTSQPPDYSIFFDGNADSNVSFKNRIRNIEIAMIKEALIRTGGKRTEAAQLLNIPLRSFNQKLKRYEIDK